MSSNIAEELEGETVDAGGARPTARVVSLYPQVTLGRVMERTKAGWKVRVGRREVDAELDPSVDPKLVAKAADEGARVVLEIDDAPRIVGTVQTRLAIDLDREGNVEAKVGRFLIDATQEALLRTPGSFLRLERHKVETYADEALIRGRRVVRVLSTLISLN